MAVPKPTLDPAVPLHKVRASWWNEQMQEMIDYVSATGGDIESQMATLESSINSRIDTIINNFYVGNPVITLSNTLNSNEIWLEGAEVSKTTYANLYAIYGDNYGIAADSSKFVLPDCRNRVFWGADEFGYLEAGLPNIIGKADGFGRDLGVVTSGAFYSTSSSSGACSSTSYGYNGLILDASRSSSIYGNSSTVQPPAIKVRVKTRYQ